MKRRSLLLAFATFPIATALRANSHPAATVVIYKDASCVCCGKWAEHLEAAGCTVDVQEVSSTSVMRRQLGMPQEFGACHTTKVGDYVIEGHVPGEEVKLLLASRPTAIGLSVRRMPVGSPGMEVGERIDRYDVLLVDREGQTKVFARYPKSNR